MRTKTLLIAAAALAAAVTSSQAQTTVYSKNVVGYINQNCASKQFILFANHLQNGTDVNQSNNAVNGVLVNGLASDPNGPPSGSNTVLYVFNGSGYLAYYYFNYADGQNFGVSGSTAGWYAQSGSPAPVTLSQGTAAYILNNAGGAIVPQINGQVLQGTNAIQVVPNGFSFLSIPSPVVTNIDAPGIGLPDANLVSDPNGPPTGTNDVYYYWTGSGYLAYYYFNVSDGGNFGVSGSTAGFYAQSGSPAPASSYPAAGQGFLFKHNGPAFNWTNTFEVQ